MGEQGPKGADGALPEHDRVVYVVTDRRGHDKLPGAFLQSGPTTALEEDTLS